MRITSRDGLEDVVKLGFNSGFDWGKEFDKASVVGLYVDDKLVGLISYKVIMEELFIQVALLEIVHGEYRKGYAAQLMGMVAIESFKIPGFNGYVALKSKFGEVDEFYRDLGAEAFGQLKIFNPNASQSIINKYLPNGGSIE
ncbi:MAG: hypothetical protein LBT80_00785 [Lactobacillaceae bacterium]|nr:hypothetical protein [Lactobacillaceae bacterium]